jgi:hypothetical protein
MKTEYHSIKDELETADWLLNPAIIPGHMGISLKDVDGMSWTTQEPVNYGCSIVSLTIHFNPRKPLIIHVKPTEPLSEDKI